MPRLTRKESQAATREMLLASAKIVFLRDGYARANLEGIAEHANYSKGAIYSNFDSKEEIFLELLRRKLDGDIAAVRGLIEKAQDTNALADGIRAYLKARDDVLDFTAVAVEFLGQAGRSRESAQICAGLYRRQRAAIAELIALLQKRTNVRGQNPDDLAAGFVALTLGLALQRGMDRKAVTTALWARVVETYMSSLLGNE